MADSFVETLRYRHFRQFCDACLTNRYIGVCHGRAGVGKTLSARRYANWDEVDCHAADSYGAVPVSDGVAHSHSIFYTVKVKNSPGQIERDVLNLRAHLRALSAPMKALAEEVDSVVDDARAREKSEREYYVANRDWLRFKEVPRSGPTVQQILNERRIWEAQIKDPTQLILIDEADRLNVSSMEQVRHIFDEGGVGVVLIGMPGLEKRLARYPQLYSRVGFVHEFRPLERDHVRDLLDGGWRPFDLALPDDALSDEEGVSAIIQATGGNFRLLHRLLAQIARVLELHGLTVVTREVVESAREALVIGSE